MSKFFFSVLFIGLIAGLIVVLLHKEEVGQRNPPPPSAPTGQVMAPTSQPRSIYKKISVDARFQKQLDTSYDLLPRNKDVQNLTAQEVHRLPPSVLLQIKPFAKIVETLVRQPALAGQALPFFKKCASSSDVLLAMRGRCLAHYKRWAKALGKYDDKEWPLFPENVRQLSEFIPSF